MTTASPSARSSDQEVTDAMRLWIERAVIGLNLCPFAKAVHLKQQIRYVVSHAQSPEALATTLAAELERLQASDPEQIDTTLLIHPFVLQDFLAYNDFLAVADDVLAALGLEGELQIASFHPDYQFADAGPDDIENYTNRSPFPALHLLRESSISRAVQAFPDAAEIYERNMAKMRSLGLAGWDSLKIIVPKSNS